MTPRQRVERALRGEHSDRVPFTVYECMLPQCAAERAMLASVWPGSVSVILPCPDTRWGHIHRGTETVAFRVPDDAELREFLSSSGPIIAPSANPSGLPPATTVEEADAYFHDDADFLVDGGRLSGVPSTVARIVDGKWDVLRPIKSIRLARTALPGMGMLAKSGASV